MTQYCTCQFAEIGKIICAVCQSESGKKKREKPLDIALDQAPSIRGRIKGDGNCFFRAVAQEITGRQEDIADLRALVTIIHGSQSCSAVLLPDII